MTGVACFYWSRDTFVFSPGMMEWNGFDMGSLFVLPSYSLSRFVHRIRDRAPGVETWKLVLTWNKISTQNDATVVVLYFLHFKKLQHFKNKILSFFKRRAKWWYHGLFKVKELRMYTEKKLLGFNLCATVSGETPLCVAQNVFIEFCFICCKPFAFRAACFHWL